LGVPVGEPPHLPRSRPVSEVRGLLRLVQSRKLQNQPDRKDWEHVARGKKNFKNGKMVMGKGTESRGRKERRDLFPVSFKFHGWERTSRRSWQRNLNDQPAQGRGPYIDCFENGLLSQKECRPPGGDKIGLECRLQGEDTIPVRGGGGEPCPLLKSHPRRHLREGQLKEDKGGRSTKEPLR